MREFTREKYSQEDIIQGIKANDSTIIKWFYQGQFRKIEHFILTNHGDEEQAKDIYQEAFLVLWRKVKEKDFRPENGTAIAGYLYQIAKNKWLDKLRQKRRLETSSLDWQVHELPEEAGEEDMESYHQLVAAGFKELGETCRSLIQRFYFQKQSMEQIAEFFGWTPATARNNKYRCIQRLKEKLGAK